MRTKKWQKVCALRLISNSQTWILLLLPRSPLQTCRASKKHYQLSSFNQLSPRDVQIHISGTMRQTTAVTYFLAPYPASVTVDGSAVCAGPNTRTITFVGIVQSFQHKHAHIEVTVAWHRSPVSSKHSFVPVDTIPSFGNADWQR